MDFIYQVSTAINVAAAPGLQDTWTKSSNTVQGAIGLGDTWLGFQGRSWGKVKFGEMYMPYKTSTDRLNPFSGTLGDYSAIMGNTGGDNRVEFGTRADDVVSYSSPNWHGFSFDAADSPTKHSKTIYHRRMTVCPDECIRISDLDRLAVDHLLFRPHCLREVLEIDLVADASSGRHDRKIRKRLLAPLEEPISLLVLLILALDVLC